VKTLNIKFTSSKYVYKLQYPVRVHRTFIRVAIALVLAMYVLSFASFNEDSCNRPEITMLRYDEDYSFLRNPECRSEIWDPLKYIVLNKNLPVYLTLGINIRERFEFFNTFDWGLKPGAGYLLQRIMPLVDMHFGTHFQAFLQLTSNIVWGRDPRPLDRDALDILQAFGFFSFGPFAIRIGRQEIQYESSRLVSIREGPNVRLAFGGLRTILHIKKWQVDGFALVPIQVMPGIFDDYAPKGQWFWGIYGLNPILGNQIGLDAYYLGRYRQTAAFEQGTERELRHTAGMRIYGKPGSVDYNTEATIQAGSFGSGAIFAWMFASDVGYTFNTLPARPRLGAQVNLISGDLTPIDADLQTFNPLFPRGSYFSEANLIGPLYLIDLHPELELKPFKKVKLKADWDFFWRQSLGDGLYLPSTLLQVPGAGNPARYIGSQGAVLIQWEIMRHTSLSATYSHFFAGPFLRLAQRSHDVDFLGLWISFAF